MELYYPILLDGATGTQLQKQGYSGDVCAEKWILEHPVILQNIQKEYIEAGSQVVYAPTFGANRIKLGENGIFDQTEEYNKRRVAISREVAGDKAFVAGDISPTGKFLRPLGDKGFEELVDIYTEQAKALEEAGVDLFAIETMMTVSDARAAILAVRSVSEKPILVTFTCDENGKTLMGSDILAVMTIMQHMDIQAFGMNCSVGPGEMLQQLKRLHPYAEVPLIAKPNAGFPEIIDGQTVYNCPPEEFTAQLEQMLGNGVGIFGGCCGSDASHIEALCGKMSTDAFVPPAPETEGKLICATEKVMFALPPDLEIGQPVPCDQRLEEYLEDLDEKQALITLSISAEEDLAYFADCQFMIDRPLVLTTDDAALLEKALRLYQGRALYQGNLDAAQLAPLAKKYGVIF